MMFAKSGGFLSIFWLMEIGNKPKPEMRFL